MAEVELWDGVVAEITSPADWQFENIEAITAVSVLQPPPAQPVQVEQPTDNELRVWLTPGPAGPPGATGERWQPYIHEQVQAASTWVIDHPLGVDPTAIQVIIDGVLHVASDFDVQFTVPGQQVRLNFDTAAVTGIARMI